MSAPRGYYQDCRDCVHYRDDYKFHHVDDDGNNYYKCYSCSYRNRYFTNWYGSTCANLRQIYDVEQEKLAKKRREEEAYMMLMYGYYMDENGNYEPAPDTGGDFMAYIFAGAFIWFYAKLICSLIASASVCAQLILLGIVMAFSRNLICDLFSVRKTLMIWTLYCTSLIVLVVMLFMGIDSYESGMFAVVMLASIPIAYFAYKYVTVPFYMKNVVNNGGRYK